MVHQVSLKIKSLPVEEYRHPTCARLNWIENSDLKFQPVFNSNLTLHRWDVYTPLRVKILFSKKPYEPYGSLNFHTGHGSSLIFNLELMRSIYFHTSQGFMCEFNLDLYENINDYKSLTFLSVQGVPKKIDLLYLFISQEPRSGFLTHFSSSEN